MVSKGTQMWCSPDSASYNALTARWKSAPKLRAWWQNMSSTEQAAWFIKWQALPAKPRFDLLQYVERTIEARELIDDAIDNHLTLAKYIRERWLEYRTLTNEAITRKFTDIVESRQAECRFERNEWLIPRFDGFQRRTRARITQEQHMMRAVNIQCANEVTSLWQGGF